MEVTATATKLSCTTRASYQYSCMVWTAGRYQRRMHVGSMHLTSGVFICCLVSNGTNLFGTTKLKLYNTCILPIFPYGLDCRAISKTVARRIDALDQWCLHMLLGIKWYQFVRNGDVRRLTKQLTAIIQLCQLTLFWRIMRMDDNADAKRILLASPSADYYYYYYYYYYKCHGLECCQSHSYGGTLQKSRFKTVAQLSADVC